MTPAPGSTRTVCPPVTHEALRCAFAIVGLSALVAAAVWLAGLSDDARRLLRFGFGGLPGGAQAGVEIAIRNAQLAGAALLGACLAPRAAPLLDVLLGALLVLNACFLGVAFGGYGGRLLAATWPHLPFELAAFALAGGAYVAARTRRLTVPALAGTCAAVAALLVSAGLVEATISNPR